MDNEEDFKLVIFGWIVTLLKNEGEVALDEEKRARVNALTDKMYELIKDGEKRGREYSLAKDLNAYMKGEQVDTLTLVQGFANVFIAIMCVDTNAETAEIKLTDLKIGDKPVGTWKVTAKKIKDKK